jgi:hypothetical protein
MCCVQEIRCTRGGITESIFTKTESYLFSCSKHQEGLSSLKNADDYRSLVDLIFCIIFPDYKKTCFQFYVDGKNPLRKVLPQSRVKKYDKIMLKNLKSLRKKDWEIISDIIDT